MKKWILFLAVVIFLCACTSKVSTVFVVRHAEKDLVYKGDDHFRPLSTSGHQRAGNLAKRLANEKITKIYATEYLRVQQTGDSLRINNQIDTTIYSARNAHFLDKVEPRKNILIIGHSNTVPEIVRLLGANFDLKIIPESEYDNLYIVKIKDKKLVEFKAEKY